VLLLIINLCFQGPLFAKEKTNVGDKIIGSTVKTLAKAFVLTINVNALKKKNIDELNKMDEKEFRKRYADVFKIINKLPAELKVKYELTETMTKEQAIKNLESLNKNKIYGAIDSIPDEFIVEKFKVYLKRKKQEAQKSNLFEEVKKFWNEIVTKTLPLLK